MAIEPGDLITLATHRWFGDLADRGIIVTDEQLIVRGWNAWLVEQTGIPAAEALGAPLFAVSPSLVARGLDDHYRRALSGETRVLSHGFHKFLIPIAAQASSEHAAEAAQSARIMPLISEGRVVGTMTLIDDVSERIAREHALREQISVAERARSIAEDASALKEEFLATLSHEIRTPLNAVMGWTHILRRGKDQAILDHGLEVIERNAAAQLRLVEDLLDTARIISGKLNLDRKPIDLRDVVVASIDVVQPDASAKRIAIRTSLPPGTVAVDADGDRLQQAIWNVLSNAVKFTPDGGAIDVVVRQDAASVHVDVSDTGQGIAADFLPHVFERFRQADASISRRHGGLGLGLALTRQIIELHGGTISASSLGLHQGTRFSISLPVSGLDTTPPQSRAPELAADSLKGINVLFVDDSTDGREMLVHALTTYGANVRALHSAAAALEVLEAGVFVPDVLVSDIGMPERDGYTFIRQLHDSWISPDRVPAIALTAYAEPEDRGRALAAGYQVHMPKPIDPARIAETIKELVTASRLERGR